MEFFMTNLWNNFWSHRGPEKALTEDDLLVQVGHTWEGKPISKEKFDIILAYIVKKLDLNNKDVLLDYCCGNGLFSYEIAKRVSFMVGIDFVQRNIKIANEQKSMANTCYILGDVTSTLNALLGKTLLLNKFLMNYSLGYFEPTQFKIILKNIIQHTDDRTFKYFVVGTPCFDLKWNFYNTEERVARHLENEKIHKDFNDGMGRWWKRGEIEEICLNLGLLVQITDQPPELSNFRMDALITSKF